MILHESCVGQLYANRVVHHHKDEEKSVRHEVPLPVVSQKLVILACLLADLDGCDVNGLIADKGTAEPHGYPDPVAKELNQEGEEVHVFNLCR